MSHHRTIQLVLLVALCACGSSRAPSDDGPLQPPPPNADTAECRVCHGSAVNAAPPHSASGATQTTDLAVGAHQRHLVGLAMRKPLGCEECHVVPATVGAPGHMDGSAAVVFDAPHASGVARAGGAQPSWNRATGTCESVYCHGATLGGVASAPVWTRVDGSQVWCGGCHGTPPPVSSGHPESPVCTQCHDSFKPDGSFDLDKHIDGVVQLTTGSCTSCHGDPARQPASIAPAPPVDGRGSASSESVGAHLRHLMGGAISTAVACSECHVVPTDAAHINGETVPQWGALARTRNVQPTWDPVRRTCTNYCHGATIADGSLTAPAWNGGPSQAACGSCHGLAPTSRHPDVVGGVTACATCHPATTRPDGSIDVAGGKHVNGLVDVDFTVRGCASCHGGTLSGTDADGVDLAPAPGKGAHVPHLTGMMAKTIRCVDCHGPLPTSMSHPDRTVQLQFGGLAAGTQWNGSSCSTSYCHGAFRGGLNGGSGAVMSWASPVAEPLGCTACHNRPHYQPHSGGDECWICHEHVNNVGTGFVQPALHLNGRVDRMNCAVGCHEF